MILLRGMLTSERIYAANIAFSVYNTTHCLYTFSEFFSAKLPRALCLMEFVEFCSYGINF